MADIILARMIDDPKIGIVFPDDPGVSGWCKDKSLIIDMAKKLGIRRLWNHFNFPIGTMFWARTSAVKSIIGLDLQWSDYPAEPVPYDGTLLHGLERLLPFAVTEAGYTIAVTNCVGISR